MFQLSWNTFLSLLDKILSQLFTVKTHLIGMLLAAASLPLPARKQ
jgi:hypothetical protein